MTEAAFPHDPATTHRIGVVAPLIPERRVTGDVIEAAGEASIYIPAMTLDAFVPRVVALPR